MFGDELVDHKTYVIACDGDLMEGISHEAIALAGHLKLNKLIVLFDDNGISIDGPLSLADIGDQVKRFEACGWNAWRIDGHDPAAIAAALEQGARLRQAGADRLQDADRLTARRPRPARPPRTARRSGADEIKGARAALGWAYAPFEIPDDILDAWREAGARGKPAHADWNKRLAALDAATRAEFERRMQGRAAARARRRRAQSQRDRSPPRRRTSPPAPPPNSRWRALVPALPEMIGGSADLTGSNNTRTKVDAGDHAADFSGRFIHYGVREHGMAAAMNGMALHGGIIPYSGTFLVFSDYCRPAIRLAALMGMRVIHVMTHDSIGLGEDGPTHQPVEHLAALARHPQPAGVPPGRRGRDGRMLAAGACSTRTARACWR